jgi:hypothetical protein
MGSTTTKHRKGIDESAPSGLMTPEQVPWPIPASMLIRYTQTDLDNLDLAERAGRDSYRVCLNRIVRRIEANATRSGAV